MSPILEKLILTGEARSLSFASFGSALSSFEIPEEYSCIIWNVQIFPFVDLTKDEIEAVHIAVKSRRVSHYYEFASDQQDKYGVVDRSNIRPSLTSTDVVPPPAGSEIPLPVNGADNFPCYWFFRGSIVILRIMTLPTPEDNIFAVGAPPPSEGQAVQPYLPASVVVSQVSGMGDPSGVDPLKYTPDYRRGLVSAKQTHVPRPNPDSVNEFTALVPAPLLANAMSPFTYPVVNCQYVLVKNSAIKKIGAI